MKKILCLLIGVALLTLSACFKLDNWDEPDCKFHGTVYDSYTGEPVLASQNDWQIQIWERSWTGHEGGAVRNRDLRIKQDGTYQNTKLFAGTYDMFPYNGPFWPQDTLRGVALGKSTQQDFTVTPYLQIVEFDYNYAFVAATRRYIMLMRFKIKAPLLEKEYNGEMRQLPNLRDVRAFVSLSTFCGAGDNSFINFDGYDENSLRVGNSKAWDVLLAEGNGVDTTGEFQIFCDMKPGYTYYVRVGACVQDAYNKYNYSEIVRVDIPQ